MDERKQEYLSEYLSLLTQKLDALLNMLETTSQLIITGEGDDEQLEKEATNFSSLYEKRAKVISKIQKIDRELTQRSDLEKDKSAAKASKPIIDKIKETAKALVEMDKKNIETAQKLTEFLKGNLKSIREGRDIANIYVDTDVSSSGYYFDRTN
jgi:uncharacterized coiled-coil DUF342 family protein